jgi:hypothetical protein
MRPAGIKYQNRISTEAVDGWWWFRCQRGHSETKRFKHKGDAVTWRTKHDAAFHTEMLRELGIRAAFVNPTLEEVCEAFLEDIRALEAQGSRSDKTTEYYEGIVGFLYEHLGRTSFVADINSRAGALYYVRQRKGQGRARTWKHLRALQTILAHAEIAVNWKIPTDAIKPELSHRELTPLSPEEIKAFFAHMKPESDERDYALAKLRLGLRGVELRKLKVGDYDVEEKLLRFVLHAKRKTFQHLQAVPSDTAAMIERRIEGKPPQALIFTCDGRPILDSSFRKRYLRASEAAGIDPPVGSIDQRFRHEHLTAGVDSNDPFAVMKAIGHRTIATTLSYRLNKHELELLRAVAENTAASLLID